MWNIALRKGKHEGLVSLETFERIQARLRGETHIAARPDVNADFPLRGFVLCGDCQKPLTANWSKSKTGKRHPYYLCFSKGCPSARKSIRRADVEGAFEDALKAIQPSETMVRLVRAMFSDAWAQQSEIAASTMRAAKIKLAETERKIATLIERIIDASQPSVITAFESKIAALEKEKLILAEKANASATSYRPFDEMFELSMRFLANPSNLWHSRDIDHQRLVLKLAIAEKLVYCRRTGLRTPKTTKVFRALDHIRNGKSHMADREGFEPSVPN
jgi:site-specific DNA recombinase